MTAFIENVSVELNYTIISNYRSTRYKCRVAGSIIMYLFVCVDMENLSVKLGNSCLSFSLLVYNSIYIW